MSIFSFKNSLLYRWIAFNAVGAGLAVAAIYQGWLSTALESENMYITHGIFGLFLITMLYIGYRIFEVNRDFSRVPALHDHYRQMISELSGPNDDFKNDVKDAIALHYLSKASLLGTIEKVLVILGVAGTIVGMIMAFRAVPHGSDFVADKVGEIVSVVLNGMSQGLYRTLVGIVTALWVMFNGHILTNAYSDLMSRILTNDKVL